MAANQTRFGAAGVPANELVQGGYLKLDENFRNVPDISNTYSTLGYSVCSTAPLRVRYISERITGGERIEASGKLLVDALHPYLGDLNPDDPVSPCLLLGSYLEMLTLCVNQRSLGSLPALRDSLLERGYQLQFIECDGNLLPVNARDRVISNQAELAELAEHAQQVEDLVDPTSVGLIYSSPNYQAVYVGTILLLYVKYVIERSVEGWWRRRLRSFCGAVGISYQDSPFPFTTVPNRKIMVETNSLISANHAFRKCLFLIFNRLHQLPGRFQPIFSVIMTLSRGHEMNHVIIVDEMLFRRFPELQRHRFLSSGRDAMRSVYQYLASLRPGDRFFAKILYDSSETSILNRNNFNPYYEAAHLIAGYVTETYKNMQGTTNSVFAQTLSSFINSYLHLRGNTGLFSMLDSTSATIGPREEGFYLDLAVAHTTRMLSKLDGPSTGDDKPADGWSTDRKLKLEDVVLDISGLATRNPD